MSGAPYSYAAQNIEQSRVNPSTIHIANSTLAAYYRRYLLQKAMSVFKWSMPEWWDKDYFLSVLYGWGYIAVVNTDRFGVIPQQCTLGGYNVYYRPREAIIANPLMRGILRPVIGEQCTMFTLQPDYCSIMDMVMHYANLMALCAETASTNLVNSKLSVIFGADSKANAESYKMLYDKIATGEPAVVVDKKLFTPDGKPAWALALQDVGANYIVSDVLGDMRKWEMMFDTEIGIPNANTDKRERLIADEVNSNNAETYTRAAMWLESLQTSCKKCRDMFGVDVSVEWRVNPNDTAGGEADVREAVNSRSV